MELPGKPGDRGRLARTVLTLVLAAAALRSFRRKKRLRGLLAGLGAVALGYSVSTGSSDVLETLPTGPITGSQEGAERGELRCAICGEPIVPGQRRKPNEDGETVHDACLEAPAQ